MLTNNNKNEKKKEFIVAIYIIFFNCCKGKKVNMCIFIYFFVLYFFFPILCFCRFVDFAEMNNLRKYIEQDNIDLLVKQIGNTIKARHFHAVMTKHFLEFIITQKYNIVDQLLQLNKSKYELICNENNKNCFGIVLEKGWTNFILMMNKFQVKLIHPEKSKWTIILEDLSINREFGEFFFRFNAFESTNICEQPRTFFGQLSVTSQLSYIELFCSLHPDDQNNQLRILLPEELSVDIFILLLKYKYVSTIIAMLDHWKISKEFVFFCLEVSCCKYKFILVAILMKEAHYITTLLSSNGIQSVIDLLTTTNDEQVLINILKYSSSLTEQDYNSLLLRFERIASETKMEILCKHLLTLNKNFKFVILGGLFDLTILWKNHIVIECLLKYSNGLNSKQSTKIMELCPHPRIIKLYKIHHPEEYCTIMKNFIRDDYLKGLECTYNIQYKYYDPFFILQCAMYNRVEIMQWFLSIGTNIDPFKKIECFNLKNAFEITQNFGNLLHQDPFCHAACKLNFEACKFFLQINHDASFCSHLLPAVLNRGHSKLAILLFTHGARIYENFQHHLCYHHGCLLDGLENRMIYILKKYLCFQKEILSYITDCLADTDHIITWLSVQDM